uniref:Uncharacterized protein n=1 Tax=Polysiphonia scopulorum TaxID=257860 RepID=A0A1Z1MHX6_9FLOR|nr:hypothetical protein [Polysiphonia scopulorum]ARW65566.1 hypothetical protein [Polysiphonia scopulorum]
MTSDLKHIYHEKYSDNENGYLAENNFNEEENLNMPTGWSFICLDETIHYYTDNLNKESSKT